MSNPHPVPLLTHPGRPKGSTNKLNTILILGETAPKAARHIADHIEGHKKLDSLTLDACKYVINHQIGTPTNKTEFTGADGGDIVIRVVEDGNGTT